MEKCSQHPPEESIIEVCDNWLRNHTGQPTWREIAEALRLINFQRLAFDIENVYESGKKMYHCPTMVCLLIITACCVS